MLGSVQRAARDAGLPHEARQEPAPLGGPGAPQISHICHQVKCSQTPTGDHLMFESFLCDCYGGKIKDTDIYIK